MFFLNKHALYTLYRWVRYIKNLVQSERTNTVVSGNLYKNPIWPTADKKTSRGYEYEKGEP